QASHIVKNALLFVTVNPEQRAIVERRTQVELISARFAERDHPIKALLRLVEPAQACQHHSSYEQRDDVGLVAGLAQRGGARGCSLEQESGLCILAETPAGAALAHRHASIEQWRAHLLREYLCLLHELPGPGEVIHPIEHGGLLQQQLGLDSGVGSS